MRHPEPLLQVLFHDCEVRGDDLAVCAGFERGNWRCEALAEHLMEWLPEFALSYADTQGLAQHNALRMIRRAARAVYQTDKYGARGEFGEVLLHIALRQVFGTIPAISKIYYKSAVNKTVEGFDCVHVVAASDALELWIGETKFYDNLSRAVRDVSDEILDHLETDYLRSEFLLIGNKVDDDWPHAAHLRSLLDENTSLDDVFERAVIPVLLTYDSVAVARAAGSSESYKAAVRSEVAAAFVSLRHRVENGYSTRFHQPLPVRVHIIMVPLESKRSLVEALDKKLKELQ